MKQLNATRVWWSKRASPFDVYTGGSRCTVLRINARRSIGRNCRCNHRGKHRCLTKWQRSRPERPSPGATILTHSNGWNQQSAHRGCHRRIARVLPRPGERLAQSEAALHRSTSQLCSASEASADRIATWTSPSAKHMQSSTIESIKPLAVLHCTHSAHVLPKRRWSVWLCESHERGLAGCSAGREHGALGSREAKPIARSAWWWSSDRCAQGPGHEAPDP